MRGTAISFLIVFLFSFGTFAQADNVMLTPTPKPRQILDDIAFGPEFTFYNNQTLSGDKSAMFLAMVKRANIHLLDNQPEGSKFSLTSYRFTSPNGWNFYLKMDQGVIEVNTSPNTVEGYEKFKIDMQDAIFTTAANEGLFPGLFVGGGHISINTEYLLENPMVYRNLLADLLVNHCELSMGIFGFDTNNAIPQVMMSEKMAGRLKMAFDQFDSRAKPSLLDIEILISAIEGSFQAFAGDPYLQYWYSGARVNRPLKYSSVNQQNVISNKRLELRAVRPQASMDVWIRQIRLLRNRIVYLSTLAEPLPLDMKFKLNYQFNAASGATQEQALKPPIPAAAALTNFKKFVEESGEDIKDHLDYVWPAWITNGDVQQFLDSISNPSCTSLLADATGSN